MNDTTRIPPVEIGYRILMAMHRSKAEDELKLRYAVPDMEAAGNHTSEEIATTKELLAKFIRETEECIEWINTNWDLDRQ